MIKLKYSQDNQYLRALEREKNEKRRIESNKKIKKLSDESRVRLQ